MISQYKRLSVASGWLSATSADTLECNQHYVPLVMQLSPTLFGRAQAL